MPVLHTTAVFISIFRWEKFTGVMSNQNQARLVSNWDLLWQEAACQSDVHGGIMAANFMTYQSNILATFLVVKTVKLPGT